MFVGVLHAVVVLIAIEVRSEGEPLIPVVALLLLHLHAYGLLFIVDVLPIWSALGGAIQPVFGVLQPGLWRNLLLVGFAAVRVAEHTPVQEWLSNQSYLTR